MVKVVMPEVSVGPKSGWVMMPPALPCHCWFWDRSC